MRKTIKVMLADSMNVQVVELVCKMISMITLYVMRMRTVVTGKKRMAKNLVKGTLEQVYVYFPNIVMKLMEFGTILM